MCEKKIINIRVSMVFGKICTEYTSSAHLIEIKAHSSSAKVKIHWTLILVPNALQGW